MHRTVLYSLLQDSFEADGLPMPTGVDDVPTAYLQKMFDGHLNFEHVSKRVWLPRFSALFMSLDFETSATDFFKSSAEKKTHLMMTEWVNSFPENYGACVSFLLSDLADELTSIYYLTDSLGFLRTDMNIEKFLVNRRNEARWGVSVRKLCENFVQLLQFGYAIEDEDLALKWVYVMQHWYTLADRIPMVKKRGAE